MILMFCFLRGGICGMVALCWVVEINIYIYIFWLSSLPKFSILFSEI
jgi:hypothetical protein